MSDLNQVRREFVESLGRIADFWGYPRAMGALYGALYLSPEPLSLDDLVEIVGVTKGAVSVNIRALEQLGMVRSHSRPGDRKDYYAAATDFWKIARTILERRQKPEFDKALGDVSDALRRVRSGSRPKSEAVRAKFFEERLAAMESFFSTLDNIVATFLQLERFRLEGLMALVPKSAKRKVKP